MEHNALASIKAAVTGIFAALTAWLGILAVPMYMLVLMNLADYLTGLAAAPCRGQRRSSAVGLQGIVKKIAMWVLVGVGAAIDWLLAYTASGVGIRLELGTLVGAAVAVWLICNEILSILENVGDMGIRLPGFLQRLTQWVATATEQAVEPAGKENPNATETDTSLCQ